MVSKIQIAAIIAAAGYSSRMKVFKPLLPLGASTVIETVADCFLKAGIDNITVVLGHNADMLMPVLDKKGVRWVYNESYDSGMYSSVVAGVKALNTSVKCVFFLPVDIPLVKYQTITQLYQVYSQNTKSIIYPVHNGRRGHPPLISSALFREILAHDGSGGLKEILSRHQEEALYIEVDDEGILLDMDTYEDYTKIAALKAK